jgi:hypothetical protein
MDDWRLTGQEKYLKAVSLVRKQYRNPTESCDHKHCEFCWDKFSEHPEDLHVGYATLDDYHWICEPCFNDFREMFQWNVIPSSLE